MLVGRWGPPALADDSMQVLRDSGANLVASTLMETRTYLAGLVKNVVSEGDPPGAAKRLDAMAATFSGTIEQNRRSGSKV
jgi:hypothetical protein